MICNRRYFYRMSFRSLFFFCFGTLVGLLLVLNLKYRKLSVTTCKVNDPFKQRQHMMTTSQANITTYDWSLADKLYNQVKIFCFINTIPQTHRTKAQHLKHTWLRHCNNYLFMSSESDPYLPTVNLNLTAPESRKHLWSKMQKILHYVYQFRDQYDFFFKADDDTFVVMDNLRYALKDLNPDDPIIASYPFTHILPQGHLSGGAGYVLSRATLTLLVEKALDKHPDCPTFDEDMEDVKVSMCAYAVGARFEHIIDRHSTIPYIVNSLDQNTYRFQWKNLEALFEWQIETKKMTETPPPPRFQVDKPFIRDRHSLLSELLISLHYVSPESMYTYHFLTYYLRPVGIVRGQ